MGTTGTHGSLVVYVFLSLADSTEKIRWLLGITSEGRILARSDLPVRLAFPPNSGRNPDDRDGLDAIHVFPAYQPSRFPCSDNFRGNRYRVADLGATAQGGVQTRSAAGRTGINALRPGVRRRRTAFPITVAGKAFAPYLVIVRLHISDANSRRSRVVTSESSFK